MEADIVVTDPPHSDSYGRNQRHLDTFIQRHHIKMNHREKRLTTAKTKRARKNAKRVRDAIRSELGQRLAREMAFGEPFSSVGLVDAIMIDHGDKPMPTDQEWADWARVA